MKKLSFLAAIATLTLFVGIQSAKAQLSDVTASLNLSITLNDVIAIDLSASPDVSFTYTTAADYAGSKTVSKTAHFTVISTQSYDITVTAGGAFSVNAGNSTPVPLNVVNIAVNRTGMLSGVGGTDAPAALSTSPQALVSAASPSIGAIYNVNYTIPSAANLVGKVADTYTTTLVYTATQL